MFEASNGIRLRKLEVKDLETLRQQKNISWQSYHQSLIISEREQQRWYDKVSCDPSQVMLIAEKELLGDGAWVWCDIGLVKLDSIHQIHRSANIGQDVWESQRGNGFGAMIVRAGVEFCFDVLNLNRIQCEIIHQNQASIKNYLANGFLQEGCRVSAVWKPGGWQDSFLFALLRDEWKR